MTIDIYSMSLAELSELNHKIVERIKYLQSVRHHEEMMKFDFGQKVSFEVPGQGVIFGTLVKFNKKSVTVIADGGQQWKVSPHLLSPVKDIKSSSENLQNVVEFIPKRNS